MRSMKAKIKMLLGIGAAVVALTGVAAQPASAEGYVLGRGYDSLIGYPGLFTTTSMQISGYVSYTFWDENGWPYYCYYDAYWAQYGIWIWTGECYYF